jgi:quercetin dioxygenase-like cupin family protein
MVSGSSGKSARRQPMNEQALRSRFMVTAAAAAIVVSAAVVVADEGGVTIQPPASVNWAATPITGPLDKPVFYTQRVRLAKGGIIPPHTHPDTRYVTVLSGELFVGRGATVNEATATRVPADTYIVVPAMAVHYSWARDGEVVYQESGFGPTATNFLKKE